MNKIPQVPDAAGHWTDAPCDWCGRLADASFVIEPENAQVFACEGCVSKYGHSRLVWDFLTRGAQ